MADKLVDIHSQHKNLLLADSDFQLEVLDSLADNRELLEEYKRFTQITEWHCASLQIPARRYHALHLMPIIWNTSSTTSTLYN